MPDLWKALGDVYGDADPDGPPTKVEPPAVRRSTPPLDDDLAAALSAALVNAPAPSPSPAPAPAPAPRPPLPAPTAPAAAAPVPPVAATPAPVPAPAPVPEPEPIPVAEAQQKVASWLVEIEQRQSVRDKGPNLDAALPEGPTWTRPDDDILPSAKTKTKAKAKRRG